MLATPHAVVGAALGVAVGDPVTAFLLGFASHFLGDRLPHTEPTTFYGKGPEFENQRLGWMIVDGVVMVAILAALLHAHPRGLAGFWGAAGGLGPDLLTNVPWLGDRLARYWGFRQFRTLHHWVHDNIPKSRWLLGAVTQLVALTISTAYLLTTR